MRKLHKPTHYLVIKYIKNALLVMYIYKERNQSISRYLMFWRKKKTPKPLNQTSDTKNDESYFFKLVLMGDGAVGKTSLRRNYLGMGFTKEHMMTIGADFAAKDQVFTFDSKEFKITFQIWDLAGQNTFSNVRSMYYKGCFGGILVFDRTHPSSFDNIPNWVGEMLKHNNRGKVPLILLGNKYDLIENSEEKVSQEQIDKYIAELNAKFAKEPYKITYYDTSALTGKNVAKAFKTLSTNILVWLKAIDPSNLVESEDTK